MIKGKYKHIGFAFHMTIPVMLGYLFLGMAFGLLLQNAGYGFLWAFLSSVIIYAGSMQFVLVTLLSGGVSLIYAALMTFFINGRHIFYGISFVEKFKKMGKAYPYMIFSLTDETYSLLCSLQVPKDMEEKKVFFWISFLDQCYWVTGSVLGALAGQYITFNSTGIDFCMTALFVVIVVEQWQEKSAHMSAIIGAVSGLAFLLLFGADRFILPALLCAMLVLLGIQKIESAPDKQIEIDGEKR